MSRENVELVRRSFAAFDRNDLAGALELAHPEIVTTRLDPDHAVYHGHDGFLQAFAEWVEDFDEWTQSPEEFRDAGDAVVVRVHQVARGAASGAQVEGDYWLVFTVAGGQITRLDIYADEAAALEAVGRRE